MDDSEVFQRLQQWYIERCDGDWEHQYGVKITTLDNPGWSVSIDLKQTPYAFASMTSIEIERSQSDWLQCWVREQEFGGVGDPMKLIEIIRIFLAWVQQREAHR